MGQSIFCLSRAFNSTYLLFRCEASISAYEEEEWKWIKCKVKKWDDEVSA